MGLSSLPTSSESVLILVLVNAALTISILKELLRSVLHLRFRAPPLPQPDRADVEELELPNLTDRFRSKCRPIRFASAAGRRPAASERTADCRVCLARFEPDSIVNRLPCGHLFHKDCVETWLEYQHATCPLCRTDILNGGDPGFTDGIVSSFGHGFRSERRRSKRSATASLP